MAIKDVTPLEKTTAKLVLTMPATLIPESKTNFKKKGSKGWKLRFL